MELETIKLKSLQEIQSIRLEPADNGGCTLRFTIYTNKKTYSESNYDEHSEVFSADEVDEALIRVKELYRLNLEAMAKQVTPSNLNKTPSRG